MVAIPTHFTKLGLALIAAIALQIVGCSQSQSNAAKDLPATANHTALEQALPTSAAIKETQTPSTARPLTTANGAANPQGVAALNQANAKIPAETLALQLQQIAQVPILLPDVLSVETPSYLHASASSDRYEVSFDHTQDCRGATVCTFGGISAHQGGQIEPASSEPHSPHDVVEPVTLLNGTPAQFTNYCGASCTASVSWINNTVLYRIYIKNGQQQDVVALANSVRQFSLPNSQPNSQPFVSREGTLTTTQDYSLPIDIRDQASITATVRHIGYAGDRVILLDRRTGANNTSWYRVKFPTSGATGWVQGSFILIQFQA